MLGDASLSLPAASRALVALVPQTPTFRRRTVTDYVLLGRTPYIGALGREGASDNAAVADVLERLELVGVRRRAAGDAVRW